MSYIKNILLLIAMPGDAWESIKKHIVPAQALLAAVLYPLLALLAVTAFAEMFYREEATLAYCIQKAIIDFAKFFFAYHISSYILTGFFSSIVNDKETANRVNTAIAYVLTVLVILNIVNNLLPTPWIFINVFYLYAFVLMRKAADFISVKSSNVFLYITAAFAIVVPFFIGFVLNMSLSIANN